VVVAALDDVAGGKPRAEALVDRAMGHRMLGRLAAITLKAPLRVLAYHAVLDPAGFEAQMEHLVERYRPVSSEQVVRWLDGATLLPGAVWVTFDDGDPTVVERGLPILSRLGIPATMFICPGVIDTDRPYWWEIIDQISPIEVARLKGVPNAERIARTEEVANQLREERGADLSRRQLSSEKLQQWLEAGGDVGNHTWDHPIMDRCEPEEQERQIRTAHDWIMDRVRPARLLYAHPNGNAVAHSDSVLAALGYDLSVMFDHRIASVRTRTRLSRLRTNADSDLTRFRAIVSGVHPTVHRLRGGR
jgi:peptidoglycan/xylan/chitin deacetylase (PgdA/CDA1 family)